MNTTTIYQLTVSPDFVPDRISGWYVFNTWLQRALNIRVHCELYENFGAQHQAIREDKVDLIYANPLDATMLVRDKNFVTLAKAQGVSDECTIAASVHSAVHNIEALQANTRVALTLDQNINLMGMMMLESVDLDESNIVPVSVDSYVLVAKALLNGKADIGFFSKDTRNEFSTAIREQLRPLVTSQTADIQHVLLASPRLVERVPELSEHLRTMSQTQNGASVLEALGFQGWDLLSQEDTEFMIDIIDTLKA
jgi:phosphonate transport system substrate-binding protein